MHHVRTLLSVCTSGGVGGGGLRVCTMWCRLESFKAYNCTVRVLWCSHKVCLLRQ